MQIEFEIGKRPAEVRGTTEFGWAHSRQMSPELVNGVDSQFLLFDVK